MKNVKIIMTDTIKKMLIATPFNRRVAEQSAKLTVLDEYNRVQHEEKGDLVRVDVESPFDLFRLNVGYDRSTDEAVLF